MNDKNELQGESAELPTIKFTSWNEVFELSNNLISVCQSAISLITDSRQTGITDYEHGEIYGSNGIDVFNVLKVAKNLIPQDEQIEVINIKKS